MVLSPEEVYAEPTALVNHPANTPSFSQFPFPYFSESEIVEAGHPFLLWL